MHTQSTKLWPCGDQRGTPTGTQHRFNKLCKKGNTFNKNVPKRQTFNTITNPYRTQHTDSKNIFQIFTTKTHHNNQCVCLLTSLLPRPITTINIFHFSNNIFFFFLKKELTEICLCRLGYGGWSFWWINVGSSQCQCLGLNGEVSAGVWGLLL